VRTCQLRRGLSPRERALESEEELVCAFFPELTNKHQAPMRLRKMQPRLYFYCPRPIDRTDFISGCQGFPPPSERG
jgi:hypothetical protein